ncbi:MAG TPA: alanine racemase [Thermoanaerobaculia bacterium]|nr:alanine racemase [Thermoanaerobaculia bacterium]
MVGRIHALLGPRDDQRRSRALISPLRPTHAVIDLDALASNYRAITGALPKGCALMPVVKADAYGHGAGHVARRLAEEGAPIFAVAVVEEGLELRRAGITQPILVMGWIGKDQLGALVDGGLTPNVHSVEQGEELREFLEGKEGIAPLPVHLKLDTGMTRLGVLPVDLPRVLDLFAGLEEKIFLEGVFQNFASADDPGSAQTEAQTRTFEECVHAVRARGFRPTMIHTDNSAATFSRLINSPSKKYLFEVTHVRPGLALYTRVPGLPSEQEVLLSDVMSFVSVVDQVKTVPPGTRVGYGGTFVAGRTTTLAIVPAGFADGVPRHLSGRGHVLIGGRRCPIAGRVSMDLTAVDATDLEARPARGAEVVFFGRQGDARLGVDEVAAAAGTVSWEILCGVGPRVPRIIVSGGGIVARETKFL